MSTPETATPAPAGVIHDIGYQRYRGVRLGRRYVVGSLYAHGLRTAFGLGRSAKAKIFPWLIVGIVAVVAAVLAAIRAQVGQMVMSYVQFPRTLLLLIILFSAIVAPELVSRDLHSGVLPLYFARPLRRSDYALAKWAALATATFLTLAGPLTLMFTAIAFTLDDLGAVWREFRDFAPALPYLAVYAVVFSAVALLVASLVKRRAVAAGAIVGAFLLTTPVVGVLSVLPSRTANELAGLASPASLVGGVGVWLFESGGGVRVGRFGPLYGLVTLALAAGCVALLLVRYRKVAAQ